MKKLLFIFVLIFTSFLSFAEQDKKVGCDIGLTTGVPVYSHRDDNVSIEESRIIVGSFADVSFKLTEPFRFIMGVDFNTDFMWSADSLNYHLDYAGWAGLKFYPGLAGLNFSIAYALGSRYDFVNKCTKSIKEYDLLSYSILYIDKKNDYYSESTAWGNGFRISFDYDFLYGSNRNVAPALGGYYRCMPRGNNNWDNIFAVYVSLGFN